MAKSKVKKIMIIFLSVLLIIGLITASVFIFKPKETKQIRPSYHVGSIDIDTGKYVESDDAIYSDMFECQGLKIEPNFSSNLKFNVYLYRFDKSFIRSDVELSQAYVLSEDSTVRYARIVIIPDTNGKSEKDHKIWFWQVYGIANDLKVTVNSDQTELDNLAEFKEYGSWADSEDKTWQKLEAIDVSKISKLALVFDKGFDNVFENVKYQYGDDNPTGEVLGVKTDKELSSNMIILDVSGQNGNIFISIKSGVELRIYEY